MATGSFAVGVELGGHRGGCPPPAHEIPKGEALQQGKENQARQKWGKTIAEQPGAAPN